MTEGRDVPGDPYMHDFYNVMAAAASYEEMFPSDLNESDYAASGLYGSNDEFDSPTNFSDILETDSKNEPDDFGASSWSWIGQPSGHGSAASAQDQAHMPDYPQR